ncbi:MAG: PilN domain-containing protein, partial [Gemmatimonadetes bacterium]|nr:PilN domain-containing protein [Gemmatimonadota bacterium]
KTFETAWDPSRPAELVARLREQLGPARCVALSVGLGFLHVKHVKLPAAPAAERRRMLALEPDRFFPVQGEPLVVSLANEDNFAFAIDAELLEHWLAAFEEWAPVENVEASPLSLARVLGKGVEGSFAVAAGPDEQGLVEMHAGRLRSARRIPAVEAAPQAQPPPTRDGAAGPFLCALGAARGADDAVGAMLVPGAFAVRMQRRRARRVIFAAAMCAVALALGFWAVDQARERALGQIREELAAVAPQAQQAVELRARLTAIDHEATAIGELAQQRPNPLAVLAALSERLPAGATVLSVQANGYDWQIEGRARDAAAIVPLLDGDDRFEDVRFLSASSRFRDGNETYETFSIAFHVGPGD